MTEDTRTDGDYRCPGDDWIVCRQVDEIFKSILKNDGPYETYFLDSHGNTRVAHGPLTADQLTYLIEKAFEEDPQGTIFRDADHDREELLRRRAAADAGRPWACDEYPEHFSVQARLRRYGIS